MQQGEPQQQTNTLNQEQNQVTPAQKLKAALHLASTMPPSKIRKNLIGLTNLAPQIQDVLLEKIDLPLQVETADADRPFLKTEFNRDGDSYRSPHTNTYFPPVEGYKTQGQFRKIEQLGAVLFAEYTKLYYGNEAIGSFFVSENGNPDRFSCGYFAKKDLDESTGFGGSWDSFNIVDIEIQGDEGVFNLSTTIMLEMLIKNEKQGQVDLTGFLKQTKTERRKLGRQQRYEQCLVVVGEMVQDLQTTMRQSLDGVYIVKSKDIIFSTRLEYTVQYQNQRRSLAQGLKQIRFSAS